MFPLKDNIPLERVPIITIALIFVNVVAYLLSIRHGGSFLGGPTSSVDVRWGAIPYELTHPGSSCELVNLPGSAQVACHAHRAAASGGEPATWETAFTAMFLHGSFLQILVNMVFLAIFGPTVEDTIGRVRFSGFYLLGGLVALAAQVLVHPQSTVPTLGASGAITAVLGGYILLYPRARIITLVFLIFFVTIIEIPATFLLGLWFAGQVWLGVAGLASPAGGKQIVYCELIGGFAFGLASIRLLLAGRQRRAPLAAK